MDARRGSMMLLLAVLHISTPARALLIPTTPPCSTLVLPHDQPHAPHVKHQLVSCQPARAIRRGAASTQTPLGGPPSRTICSAAAKGVPFLGRGGTSAAVDDLDRDGSAPLTRAEALTGFVASIVVSSGVLLSEVSRARADADAGPGGLGVVDDLLADCPSVRGNMQPNCCRHTNNILFLLSWRLLHASWCTSTYQRTSIILDR